MTSGAAQSMTRRGRDRHEQLVRIGVTLLAEGGWPAVTARAVAERARIKPGLLHHYFGGLPGFHAAVAARAHAEVVEPLFDAVLEAPDVSAATRSAPQLVAKRLTDKRDLRLACEVLGRALRDPSIGTRRCSWIRTAHEGIASRLGTMHPQWSPQCRKDTAALLAALLDGLIVQQILDPEGEADTADAPATDGG
ncbi:TetR family transcriptional regulator [Actinomadura meridiana]|uniref:TetR family transcriptional regulator n=1 Tax=Actinomadura meridiana TaxID=559626 RepID=A0ABP8CKR4_9ACTN